MVMRLWPCFLAHPVYRLYTDSLIVAWHCPGWWRGRHLAKNDSPGPSCCANAVICWQTRDEERQTEAKAALNVCVCVTSVKTSLAIPPSCYIRLSPRILCHIPILCGTMNSDLLLITFCSFRSLQCQNTRRICDLH